MKDFQIDKIDKQKEEAVCSFGLQSIQVPERKYTSPTYEKISYGKRI